MMEASSAITEAVVTIKIVGIGGGGNHVLMRLADSGLDKNQLVAVNTDIHQLREVDAVGIPALLIGSAMTKGRGTGGDPEKGQRAAIADAERIADAINGANLVFITAGMGKGVGTGVAPVVAKIAHDMGILTVGVVTMPFSHEGCRRMEIARDGVKLLREHMDALVEVKNDNIQRLPEFRQKSVGESFGMVDDVLRQSISSIVEMIQNTGIINVDFADVTTIFKSGEDCDVIMGMGTGTNALSAVQAAISSPLIETSVKGARALIVNLTSSSKLPLYDVKEANEFLYDNTHPEVENIIGLVVDDSMGSRVKATVIATNFDPAVVAEKNSKIKPIQFGNKELKNPIPPLYTNKKEQSSEAASEDAGNVADKGPELMGFMQPKKPVVAETVADKAAAEDKDE
ncbi:MAG: cell division FtsZ family protein [Anaerovibrio sp.]|uniref:cell division protein FtsZ n=1 Tax=Anaerovibrio sp. TaxID=1872532 RepID=UPI0025FB266B|nr:cell division protein FtsZ [Anaerovibrio sp.]MCR5176425.1 cell division FtsZ family protein [Anaerovibrio sp.]